MSKRVIDVLRAHFPGAWTYEHPTTWIHEDGWQVWRVGHLAYFPGGDIDDGACIIGYSTAGAVPEGTRLPRLPRQGEKVVFG